MSTDRISPPPSNLPPNPITWAYLRDSGGSGQDRSIEQQRQIITEYCAKHNLQLVQLFEDLHQSGKTTAGRTQFDQMISLTNHTKPHLLLIWNFARFARNIDDSQIYKSILRKRGVVIHPLTDNIPEGPYSVVIETIIHVADEHKRAEAATGAWRGLHHLVRQGAVPGTPPRGFIREPITVTSEQGIQRTAHRWVPDPQTIPRVQRAFAMRAAGRTLKEIKDETRLYNDLNSYATFFRNRIYIGTLDYGDKEYPNYCQPVIDDQTWNAVQAITAKSAQRQKSPGPNQPRRAKSSYLFSGLAYCARCGSPLFGQDSPQRGHYGSNRAYRCTRGKRKRDCDLPRIPTHALELAVIEELDKISKQPQYIAEMRAIAESKNTNATQEYNTKRASLRAELKTTRAKLTNVSSAIEATKRHSQTLLNRLAELETDAADIQNKLNKLASETPATDPLAEPAEIQNALAGIAQIIQNAPTPAAQTILRGIIAKISIDRIENQLYIGLDIRLPKKKAPPHYDIIPPSPQYVSTAIIPLGALYINLISIINVRPREAPCQ